MENEKEGVSNKNNSIVFRKKLHFINSNLIFKISVKRNSC